ncbi:hypothetical protein K440DRAFT_659206 [Wilcoxina mikolae CBS 423.85]|nr:hypothetical protein K440DRAFT_659206 [Wilcoxina mikolae CBS 423.85]
MGKKRPSSASTTTTTSDTVRLHIAPLTADTASSILPADTDLSTISYHTLPTFPESPFGFVDLPVAAAEKLKKKLRGAIFRGVKVRVEDARAEEWKSRLAAVEEEGPEKKRVKREKRKKEEGLMEAFQLPDERRIARGWTEKSDKKKKKDKRGECLFKAGIPANKADLIVTKEKTKEEKALEKEEKKRQKKEDKKKKMVIKEFENTQKFPNFLKESQLDPTIRPADLVGEFVEEVGWVNGKGVVVEQPVKKKSKKDKKKKEAVPEPVDEKEDEPDSIETVKKTASVVATVDVDILDTASVSSEEAFYDVLEQNEESPVVEQNSNEKLVDEMESEPNPPEDEETAATSSESEAESEESDDDDDDDKDETKLQSSTKVPETSSEAPTKTAASPAPARERPTLTIHPLEAIYKPTALTEDSPTNDDGFKFGFGGDFPESDDNGSDQDASTITTTPYKDPSRYRSSAPTPDTAIGNKRFFSPDSTSPTKASFTPSTPHAPSSHLPGSDVPLMFPHYDSPFLHGLSIWSQIPTPKAFLPKEGEENLSVAEIWKNRFYEQRGEWNREWKRRRKEALKTKRKRERNGPGPSGNRA